MIENPPIHCGGIIVFTQDLEFVTVISENGNHGFPKGKREKGETLFATALRELREETGLQQEDIELIQPETVYFDEISNKGNPCVRYWLAEYKSPQSSKEFNFIFDITELNQVLWMNAQQLLPLLTLKNRSDILVRVVKFIKENLINKNI